MAVYRHVLEGLNSLSGSTLASPSGIFFLASLMDRLPPTLTFQISIQQKNLSPCLLLKTLFLFCRTTFGVTNALPRVYEVH